MPNNELEELSFENAFKRLEETVTTLERGGLTLQDAVALYEEGLRLAQICQKRLDEAELRITRLSPTLGAYTEPSNEEEDPPF